MAKFRKKPIVIEAFQFNGYKTWFDDQPEWIEKAYDDDVMTNEGFTSSTCELKIKTLEGKMTVSPGDWVIQGVSGEIYPCKPDIFEKTYEKVET